MAADYRAMKAEYLTAPGDAVGNTVIAKDVGNKQLADDFVPGDPRRGLERCIDATFDDITYASDQTGDAVPILGGLTARRRTPRLCGR